VGNEHPESGALKQLIGGGPQHGPDIGTRDADISMRKDDAQLGDPAR
jgi:hypothetical protein